jgi:ribosomal protein S18 acetylase RimI-like enzyme
MNSMGVRVRQADVTDLAFIASMAVEASTPPFPTSFWNELATPLGLTGPELVAQAIQLDIYSWGRLKDFLVLEADGVPVASCAALHANDMMPAPLHTSRLDALTASLGCNASAQKQFRSAYLDMWGHADRTPFAAPPAPWIIENVAVAQAHRGKGFLAVLLNTAMERGAANGCDCAGLTVIIGNEAASRSYLGLGFEAIHLYGPEHFENNFPGVVKMRVMLPIALHANRIAMS